MRLRLEPRLSPLELLVELRVPTVEVFRTVVAIDLEHVFAFEEGVPGAFDLGFGVSAILGVEGRVCPGLVPAVLGFALGTPLSISLRPVPLLLELVEVRVLVFSVFCLFFGPLMVALSTRVFRMRALLPLSPVI